MLEPVLFFFSGVRIGAVLDEPALEDSCDGFGQVAAAFPVLNRVAKVM